MGNHVQAINYFKKALKLDRTCLAAWTLMGHEFLEMKNIAGAIESYRNSVE
jgi:anaphase-promoting complex subunit 8